MVRGRGKNFAGKATAMRGGWKSLEPLGGWVGLVLAFYLRDVGSIPAHSTKGSEGCISGDRLSILGVVRIPHKAVGLVAVPTDW